MRRILVWINLTFVLLILALGALMVSYWYGVLEPRLRQEAGANAALLAQAQSVRLADALSGAERRQLRMRLTESMDEILAFTDPESDTPFFLRLSMEADYDTIAAERGSLDLWRGAESCPDCFQAEVPVFDPATYELLGLARFWVSDRFFRQLSGDIRGNLLAESGWALGILVLVWISVIVLLTQLQRQTEQRRQAEQALWRNQQRYQRLLDGLSGYFAYARAPSGRFDFVSESVQRVLGVTPEAFREGVDAWLADGDSRALLEDNLRKGLDGEQQAPFEIVLRDGRGELRHIECAETPLVNSDGAVQALEGIARDVTPQRELMRELQAAKDKAEYANQTKSRFLANVSHEIRTPMNAVIGLTGLALGTDLSVKQRDYLKKIKSSAHSLLEIINDILDISKIEADSMELETVDFALDDVLQQLADVAAVKAQEKGAELLFATGDGVPARLRGDPLRLGQILLNLTNNAVKFTDAGEILVRTERVREADDYVVLGFAVRDTGIGIEAAKLPGLFEAFSQADTSNTRVYGGTGLGLAICKRLVAMMQGRIEVQSEPGAGSTFRFTARFARPRTEAGAPRITPARLRGLHTLVVDDNDLSREILGNALSSFSFDVTAVASGAAALEALDAEKRKGHPYRLVLMDWKMPGLDGMETTRRLRSDRGLKDDQPKVILVSAYTQEGPERQAQAVGFDGFLAKPVSQSTLFNAVLGALGFYSDREPPAHIHEATAARPLGFYPGTRVLLVEDNPINQQIALEVLQKTGLDAQVAGDGAQALQTLQQEDFAAVLMDVQMPVMDGIEATRRLRQDPRLKDLPVIAMTAHAMAGDEQRCLDSGMNDYISKPVDAERLVKLLHRWIPDTPDDLAGQSVMEQTVEQAGGPPALPGVDAALALHRASGNRELMLRLHKLFLQSYRDGAERLRRMLELGKHQEAAALAHTIKGAAGGIAANGVFTAALALERVLAEEGEWDAPWRSLEQELAVLAEGDGDPSAQPAAEAGVEERTPADGTFRADEVVSLLRELEQYLENNNMQAMACFTRLQELLRGEARFEAGLRAMRAPMERLEFGRAREQLAQLVDEIEP